MTLVNGFAACCAMVIAACAGSAAATGQITPGLVVTPSPRETLAEALRAAHRGPAEIRFDRAVLRLPRGMSFVPQAPARRYLAMTGQGPTLETVGVVFPDVEGWPWHAVLEFHQQGHVRDTDASWNAEAMLKRIRETNARVNPDKRRAAIPELDVLGWIEPPTYSRERHSLAWAIAFRSKGAAPVDEASYRIFALGRNSHFEWRVDSRPGAIGAHRDELRSLWGAIEFDAGSRHSDFRLGADQPGSRVLRDFLPER